VKTILFHSAMIRVGVFCWFAAALAAPARTIAADAQAPVTLEESGPNATLSNGVLTAVLSKSKASIAALRYRGFDMLRAGYYSMDGGRNYRTPANCRYKVKICTPDLVDVGMTRVWHGEPQAFDIEIHYVLRRGEAGLYTYALLDHPAAYPATGVSEWRMVWKLSDDLLERIYVDELRNWEMPTSRDKTERTGIAEIEKVLSGPRAGKFNCKYDFNANYWDLGCWGHASNRNKVGAWIVLGSHEFFNDGPTKQDLTAASSINHIHFGMNHYNGSSIRVQAGQAWQKIFGPFLLYCNYDRRGGDACWADAKARAKTEAAAWPYAWLSGNRAYPSAGERGTVAGRFRVKDPLKPAGYPLAGGGGHTWVGLAQPAPGGNWQFESLNYQFWTKSDDEGNFTIPHVRPGIYTLYAFTDGEVGEFARQDVRVEAGKTTALGEIVWEVKHRGRRIAWEIGVPDRTAKEFRHGKDYFQGYLWTRFQDEFSNPLEYFVGTSDWAKDWNYAQTRYGQDGSAPPHTWRIHFHLAESPQGETVLTLAIASADHARIQVFVNGDRKPVAEVAPAVQGGNALVREGIHAKYCVQYVTIPAGRLKAGENTIALALAGARSSQVHVMYDYLSLELP
jgi:rhamnogalacturonan endolyase